jgi:hypothetical protein
VFKAVGLVRLSRLLYLFGKQVTEAAITQHAVLQQVLAQELSKMFNHNACCLTSPLQTQSLV